MRAALADIARQRFDVIVIGGGINGAGVARAAQRAGYTTLLVERNDFGCGTTSRATRLIHGGLRYLEHGELGLVLWDLDPEHQFEFACQLAGRDLTDAEWNTYLADLGDPQSTCGFD